MNKSKYLLHQAIKEAEAELYLLQRERCHADLDIGIGELFAFHGSEAMMRAKFFHECMVKKIPCILEVRGKFGRMDAIIEINDQFYVIELKVFHGYHSEKECMEQLLRYANSNYPVILVTHNDFIPHVLVQIENSQLENKVYKINSASGKLIEITYPQ